MTQALREPGKFPPPPELAQFRQDATFWERFGARANPENLDDWPEQQVRDYITILNLEAQVIEEQRNSGGGPSASGRAAATEDVFNQLPRVQR